MSNPARQPGAAPPAAAPPVRGSSAARAPAARTGASGSGGRSREQLQLDLEHIGARITIYRQVRSPTHVLPGSHGCWLVAGRSQSPRSPACTCQRIPPLLTTCAGQELAVLQQQLDAGIDGDECASLRRQVADGIEAQIERLERKRAARLSALDTDNSGSQAL